MFERPPNGFFVRDLILFNHLRRGGYVAKGFVEIGGMGRAL